VQKILALSTSLLLFSGCGVDLAVIKPWEYAPPSPNSIWNPAPVAHQSHKQAEKMTARIISATLPDQKEALSLAEVIDIALKNNYATKETWALARVAAATYGQSQQNLLPAATGSYTFDRSRSLGGAASSGGIVIVDDFGNVVSSPTQAGGAPITYLSVWGPQLALSYLVFDFGQTRSTSRAALEALYKANLTHNREVQSVIQTITSDYYNYLYQVKLRESYEQDVADAQKTLDSATSSLRTGVRNVSDVLQAKSQLLQNQTLLVKQRQAVQEASSQLLTDMGLPAHLSFEVEKMPENPRLFEIMASVNELISLALEERFDLQAAEADLRSRNNILSAARRALLPSINSNFNVGRSDFRGTGIPGTITDHYDFELTFTLTWQLFNGLYNLNTIRKAEASREYSKAALYQTELQVIEDITNAKSSVSVARDAMRYTHDFLDAAEEEYKVSLAQYRSGTTDILRVISAQTSLANARSVRAGALQSWYTSLSTLAYAAGVIQRDPRTFLQESSQ